MFLLDNAKQQEYYSKLHQTEYPYKYQTRQKCLNTPCYEATVGSPQNFQEKVTIENNLKLIDRPYNYKVPQVYDQYLNQTSQMYYRNNDIDFIAKKNLQQQSENTRLIYKNKALDNRDFPRQDYYIFDFNNIVDKRIKTDNLSQQLAKDNFQNYIQQNKDTLQTLNDNQQNLYVEDDKYVLYDNNPINFQLNKNYQWTEGQLTDNPQKKQIKYQVYMQ